MDAHWLLCAAYTNTHELTHVFEFLIEEREWLGTDVWLKEGIAVCVGGVENTDTTQYYVLFELAMRYLLDKKGLGKSCGHVLSLFYDVRKSVSFPVSFQKHFEISVSDYENEFYDCMKIYLGT